MDKKIFISVVFVLVALYLSKMGSNSVIGHLGALLPQKGYASPCDASLWNHVYPGDPRKFSKPQDRLKVLKDCVTVTGTLVRAKTEADGDFHITLDLDLQYKSMLNDKNLSGQHGYLVVEPVCSNPVTQKDTIAEHSCDNFSQKLYNPSMVGKHVSVTGVYVEDQEHGWREIHPVTSIRVK